MEISSINNNPVKFCGRRNKDPRNREFIERDFEAYYEECEKEDAGIPSSETLMIYYNPYLLNSKFDREDFQDLQRMPLDKFYAQSPSERLAMYKELTDTCENTIDGIRIYEVKHPKNRRKKS